MVTKKRVNPEEFLKKNSPVSALTKNTKKSAEDPADTKEKRESKSLRTTLLFRKTSWNDFVTLAHLMNRTPNDMLNDYLDRVTAANMDLIKKHREELEEAKKKVKDVL